MVMEKDKLEQFLSEDAQFVIKKENDKMLIVTEAVIGGKIHHVGRRLESFRDLQENLSSIVDCGLATVRKSKKLAGDVNIEGKTGESIDNDKPKINFGDRFFQCSSCSERESCRGIGACHKWKYYLGE